MTDVNTTHERIEPKKTVHELEIRNSFFLYTWSAFLGRTGASLWKCWMDMVHAHSGNGSWNSARSSGMRLRPLPLSHVLPCRSSAMHAHGYTSVVIRHLTQRLFRLFRLSKYKWNRYQNRNESNLISSLCIRLLRLMMNVGDAEKRLVGRSIQHRCVRAFYDGEVNTLTVVETAL